MQARENKLTKVPSQVQVACASSSVRPQAGMRHIMALISCRGSFLFNFSNLAVSNRRLLSGSEEHRQLGAYVASGRVACAGAAELHAHEASRTKPGPSGATRSLTVSGPRLPLTTHWQSSMGLSQPAAACGFNLSVRVQPLPHTNGTGSVNIPLVSNASEKHRDTATRFKSQSILSVPCYGSFHLETVSLSRIGASGSQPPARNANPLQFNQNLPEAPLKQNIRHGYSSTSKSKT